jgi:indolepyruvate ferredoxin oxidoreductase alpha subunit
MKSQMWLVDPRPDLPTIVRLVEQGFELSEASSTPVMLMLRIRACHLHGRFVASDNRRPAFTAADALAAPRRSYDRIILPPSTYQQEREKIERRWPAAVEYIARHKLNESHAGDLDDLGLVLQGGLANTVLRALERLGLADVFGLAGAALRAQRHLPPRARGARGVRGRQARPARRRGRSAGVPGAGDRPSA